MSPLDRRRFLTSTGVLGVTAALSANANAGAAASAATPAGDGQAADPPFDPAPAAEALERLLPGHHTQFELRALAAPAPGDDHYRVEGASGRIVVSGTTPAVQLAGVGAYLRRTAHAHISWTGEQLDLPERLPAPAEPLTGRANVPHRFAYNDTSEGYTGAYRDWPQWERALDVLALHGINEVLLYVGADAVYHAVLREFGYTDAEARAWIPGPAHQPWWLLQNMSGFAGPVSAQLLSRRAALGGRIAARIRELGMTPVLPGYFGTVPEDFAARNPGANVVPQGGWVGFTRPGWLDPRDPHFARVAASFYRHQSALFGEAGLYKMDLLHEGGLAGNVPVGEAAKAVETALRTAHPDALWAILGWQTNPRKEIVQAVDRERMLIVDGLSDRFPSVNDRETDWLGTPYAFGSIWNFGGHTVLGANTPDWAELYPRWRDKPGSKLAGIAAMPEAADNNAAALALLTDLAWTDGPIDTREWFHGYATARYGADDPHAAAAWEVLRTTAYGTRRTDSWSEQPDSLYCARPSLTTTTAASWGPRAERYDTTAFDRALTELLAVAPELRDSPAYRYDLMDVARQALANRARLLLPQIKAAYDAKDQERFGELTALWLAWIKRLDRIVGTDRQHLLGRHLAQAAAWAADEEEAARLDYDCRSLVTTWGHRAGSDNGGLHDYANREWQGLLGDFYHGRWQRYFAELGAALRENRAPAAIDWFAHEDAWARDRGTTYSAQPRGDIHALAGDLAASLARDPHQALLTASADRATLTAGSPVTVTATLTNRNGFAPAQDVALGLTLPDGVTAEPLTPLTAPALAPGQTLTVRWRVSLAADGGDLVLRLPVRAAYTTAGQPAGTSASVRLLKSNGVAEPYRTVSFNNASFGQSGDQLAIEGGGADLWGNTKQFGAVYLPGALTDGATATVRVTGQDPTGPWARTGLIVRSDLTAQSARGFLNLALTPDHGCVLSWDSDDNGTLDRNAPQGSYPAPVLLRLTRRGDTYTGECSTDGTTWNLVGSATVPGGGTAADVGVFMTAADGGGNRRGLSTFEGFRVG
ncbi:alpha-N-acetylglucosaminidase TIM-barrel domain-containing protein [Streptomyces sp. NPDC051940]|uniref:alpha-N-acetylglucosaminidase TIM-barrel domain-containing protein n=1 Tax=Streptomyces sp. NPDC051940 TaxID=3155675 RepID=UPI00341E25D3